MPNPYMNRSMLRGDSPMFYGRERELREIQDRLATERPQSCAVVGDRRIGKSSLLHRIYWQIKSQEERWKNYVPVYLDAQAFGGVTQGKFFSQLRAEFLKHINPTTGEKTETAEIDYERFEGFVKTQSQNHKFVVFIDEFDEFADNKEFDDGFFSGLRALGNGAAYNLAYVTSSRTALEELCHRKRIETSQFWNIFTQITLGLLAPDAAKVLRTEPFQNAGIAPHTLPMDVLQRLAGDHPFFIQLVCAHFYDERQSGGGYDEVRLRNEARPYIHHLWEDRSLEEKVAVRVFMALEGKRPRRKWWQIRERKPLRKFEGLPHRILDELELRGILTRQRDTYQLFSYFFGECAVEFPLHKSETSFTKGIKEAAEVAAELGKLLQFVKELKGFLGKDVIDAISGAISKLGGEK
ncbi:ATP-binding protein [Candidatus Poribacteria bacterium]|nr:ATP-binding protein [Candidatus Poribacteria bacterium]